jgi:hypothetical protein
MTLQEVDAEVQRLMRELGIARRRTLRDIWATGRYWFQQQHETITGTAAIAVLAYFWPANIP